MSGSSAAADWGDIGDLGETAAFGDDTGGGEPVDFGDVGAWNEAPCAGGVADLGDVAACAVESAIVSPVPKKNYPRRFRRTVLEVKERSGNGTTRNGTQHPGHL